MLGVSIHSFDKNHVLRIFERWCKSQIMARKHDIHVVPHAAGWATKKEGASRAGSVSPTKAEALERAREQAKREGVEVVQHKRDGRIQDSDSFGHDPCPPRDRKH